MRKHFTLVGVLALLSVTAGCDKKFPTAPDELPVPVLPVTTLSKPICKHYAAIERQAPIIVVKQDDSNRIIAVSVEILRNDGSGVWDYYASAGGASPVKIDAEWHRVYRISTASEVCYSEKEEFYIDDPNPTGSQSAPLPVPVPECDIDSRTGKCQQIW